MRCFFNGFYTRARRRSKSIGKVESRIRPVVAMQLYISDFR
jgi:hypothetical protein